MPRFARSVRTTDRALLIDGDEFPFYVQDSLTVELLSPPSGGAPGLFVVTIGLMVEGEVCILPPWTRSRQPRTDVTVEGVLTFTDHATGAQVRASLESAGGDAAGALQSGAQQWTERVAPAVQQALDAVKADA